MVPDGAAIGCHQRSQGAGAQLLAQLARHRAGGEEPYRVELYDATRAEVATVARSSVEGGQRSDISIASVGAAASILHFADPARSPHITVTPAFTATYSVHPPFLCRWACTQCAAGFNEACAICFECDGNPEGPCDPDTDPHNCECPPEAGILCDPLAALTL